MGLTKKEEFGTFAIVLSDGSIRVKCDENDPEAVRREYETSDKQVGVKFEKVFSKISGKIKEIKLVDGDYGTNLNIVLLDGSDEYILSLSASSNFGEDAMKKLPNIKLDQEVEFAPYSFTDQSGKNRRGVSITQGEVKIKSFFVSEDGKTSTNGYPVPAGDTSKYNSNKWKMYFMEANEFLKEYITENIINKMANSPEAIADAFGGEEVTKIGGVEVDF